MYKKWAQVGAGGRAVQWVVSQGGPACAIQQGLRGGGARTPRQAGIGGNGFPRMWSAHASRFYLLPSVGLRPAFPPEKRRPAGTLQCSPEDHRSPHLRGMQ